MLDFYKKSRGPLDAKETHTFVLLENHPFFSQFRIEILSP